MLVQSAPPPSKEEARREYARRRLGQRNLIHFGQYMMPTFKDYPHQRLLAEKLALVERYVVTKGKEGIGNLMVMMPPQHGKSTTVSHLFPAFELGRYPDWPFITTSYNEQKATGNSRTVRDLIKNQNYRKLFGDLAGNMPGPVEMSSDVQGVSEWKLASPHSGGMIAAGVGGGVTGYPSKISIIDDPFKNRAEADSVDNQTKTGEWYETSIYTRRQVGSAIILFHTRWNVNDLAGQMIKQMVTNPKADQWVIVFLPALALEESEYPTSEAKQRERMADEGVFIPLKDQLGRMPGEALCPDMMPAEMLISIKDNMTIYNWGSMYQQMPIMKTGNMFKREWFKTIERIDQDVKFVKAYWYWDKAATAGSGDYTSGVLMAKDQFGRIWVLQVVRGQWSTFQRDAQIRKAWNASKERFGDKLPTSMQLWHQRDPAGAGLDSARYTNIALEGLPAHFEPPTGDKEVRADPWSTALEADNVLLLKATWNKEFIDEHVLFPHGGHDDQVDAASSCFTRLTLRGPQREVQSYQG